MTDRLASHFGASEVYNHRNDELPATFTPPSFITASLRDCTTSVRGVDATSLRDLLTRGHGDLSRDTPEAPVQRKGMQQSMVKS